jgi:hypothetical protein
MYYNLQCCSRNFILYGAFLNFAYKQLYLLMTIQGDDTVEWAKNVHCIITPRVSRTITAEFLQ